MSKSRGSTAVAAAARTAQPKHATVDDEVTYWEDESTPDELAARVSQT